MLLLLALLAAPPAVAAVNMSTYGALRVSVVREPHHRLPVLARQHSSAGVRLPGFRGRVRQGQRIPVELLLEFPGYGYLLREQLLHIFMHYICLCLNMCHQSAIGFVAAACLYCLHQISFSCLSITYLIVPAPLHVAVRALCCPAVCAVMTDDGRRRQRVQRHRDECRLALLSFQCYGFDGLVC